MPHNPAVTVAWLLLLALLTCAPARADTDPRLDSSALDAVVRQQMEEAGIVGVGAAILIDRRPVWMKGYGFADRARAEPFTPHTVLNIGSISKVFVAAAMMRAVEEGKLSLDTDIRRYLPFDLVNPHQPDAAITLRQLATHTAGIRDRWSVYQATYHYGDQQPEPLGVFLRHYLEPGGALYSPENFLAASPGTQQEYSNIGAALAGYVVELATGTPLDVYAGEHIFAPLGMHDSAWRLTEDVRRRHSTLYIAQNGLTTPIPLYRGTTWPDGGVRTSVSDLSRFFSAMLAGGDSDGRRILQRASVDEIKRFQFSREHAPVNIDLDEENAGLFWSTKFNATRVGHGGSDPGIKTEMLANLDGDLGVVLFSNTSLGGSDMKHYLAILMALWQQAEEWQRAGAAAADAR